MIELHTAVRMRKPIVALLDPDVTRGGMSVTDVRERLHELLRRKIERPTLEISASGQALLGAVSALLGAPPPE